MELQPLFEEANFAISHDDVHRWLYVTWSGQYDCVAAIAGCLLILRYVQHTDAHMILNDSSEVLDGWDEVARWIGEDFFRKLADSGVEAIAWVKAHDWPAQSAINETMRHVSRPLVDTFDDTIAAYRWLDNIR